MRLHVEDELAGEALGARLHQLGLARLGGRDLEHGRAVDLVHRQERRGHAAARLQELPPAQAETFAVVVGQLEDAALDALLDFALGRREILAVRHDLGGYRGCSGSRFGTDDQTLLSFAEPGTHRHLPRDRWSDPRVRKSLVLIVAPPSLDPPPLLHNVRATRGIAARGTCRRAPCDFRPRQLLPWKSFGGAGTLPAGKAQTRARPWQHASGTSHCR